jgi:hypothetical protein
VCEVRVPWYWIAADVAEGKGWINRRFIFGIEGVGEGVEVFGEAPTVSYYVEVEECGFGRGVGLGGLDGVRGFGFGGRPEVAEVGVEGQEKETEKNGDIAAGGDHHFGRLRLCLVEMGEVK